MYVFPGGPPPKKKENKVQKKMKFTPPCSPVVPHPSAERAQTALTSVIGRERVYYGYYTYLITKEFINKCMYVCSRVVPHPKLRIAEKKKGLNVTLFPSGPPPEY